jgi:hypothetical protein
MAVNIFARWRNQSPDDMEKQDLAWSLRCYAGKDGFLIELYDGNLAAYPGRYLFAEAFSRGTRIKAATLRKRLPQTLAIVEKLERQFPEHSEWTIETIKQQYRDFVELCERKEKETGEPVLIVPNQ